MLCPPLPPSLALALAGSQAYFRTRCRWAVLEFLTEAKQVMDDIRQKPLHSLTRQGKAVAGLSYQGPGMKGGEFRFGGASASSAGSGGGFRGIQPGDFVVLSPSDYSRCARRIPPRPLNPSRRWRGHGCWAGTSSAGHAPRALPPFATKLRGSGPLSWARPEEMSVEKAGMPLILKALDKSGLEKMQQRFGQGAGVTYRMDKLGNRTSFSRQLVRTFPM